MLELIRQAAEIAVPTDDEDARNFWIAAIGIRSDGVQVSAKNGAVYFDNTAKYHSIPSSHAEGRVLRKLGRGGILYVARVLRLNGELAMSRPCPMCQVRIKAAKVEKVFYSINESQYGLWIPETDTDRVFSK